MTDTVRERVLAAFFEAIEGITGVYNLAVERNRDTEVTQFPTLVVLDGPHQADDTYLHGVSRCLLTVVVEGYVQAEYDGETPHLKWDELYGKIVQVALADLTLGGLAVDVEEQPADAASDAAAGHVAAGACAVTFQIEYWTRQGDPYTPGP